MPADDELLRRHVESRSEEAFAAFVQRHLNLVYFAALRRVGGNAALAEDVTQAVFTSVARHAPSLMRHATVTGWLYTTTRNLAAKAVRSEQTRQRREEEFHLMRETDLEAAIEWERLRPVIDDTLEKLNPREREAVLLRFFEGRAFAEIGTALKISEDAARMRVERALEKLHALLKRRGVTSTAGGLVLALTEQSALAVPAGMLASVTGSALVGSVAGVSPIAAAFGFMSTTKIVASTAGAFLFLALATTLWDVRAERASAATLTAQRQEISALSRQMDERHRQFQTTQDLANGSSASVARSSTSHIPVEDEGRGPFGPRSPGARARGRALMEAHPEIRTLLIQQKRAFFAQHYQRLYRDLALDDAQKEAFENIVMAGASNTYANLPGMGTVTLDAVPVLTSKEKATAILKLLGPTGFEQWDNFQISGDSRVNQLASSLYFTDTPLTADQGEQLQNLLRERYRTHREEIPENYWNAVSAASRAFLSEPQLNALQILRTGDEVNFSQQLNQRARASSSQ